MTRRPRLRMGFTAVGVVVVAPVAVLGVLTRPDVVAALIVVGSLITGSVAGIASRRHAPADSRHRGVKRGPGTARSSVADCRTRMRRPWLSCTAAAPGRRVRSADGTFDAAVMSPLP